MKRGELFFVFLLQRTHIGLHKMELIRDVLSFVFYAVPNLPSESFERIFKIFRRNCAPIILYSINQLLRVRGRKHILIQLTTHFWELLGKFIQAYANCS